MIRYVSHSHRTAALEQDPEQTSPVGQVTDQVGGHRIDAGIDEASEESVGPHNAHGCVSSGQNLPGQVRYSLQQNVEVEFGCEGQTRLDQPGRLALSNVIHPLNLAFAGGRGFRGRVRHPVSDRSRPTCGRGPSGRQCRRHIPRSRPPEACGLRDDLQSRSALDVFVGPDVDDRSTHNVGNLLSGQVHSRSLPKQKEVHRVRREK